MEISYTNKSPLTVSLQYLRVLPTKITSKLHWRLANK